MKQALNIYSLNPTPFAAALALNTTQSKAAGIIQQEYPLLINDQEFASGMEAFVSLTKGDKPIEPFQALIQILTAKLQQYPILAQTITKSGGIDWLKTCKHQPNHKENNWTGIGYNSAFITALINAYREVAKPTPKPIAKLKTTPQTDQNREVLANKVIYNAISQQLIVYFSNKQRAEEWGKYLQQELLIGQEFSIEDSEIFGVRFELVMSLVEEPQALILAESTNFNHPPGDQNPKLD